MEKEESSKEPYVVEKGSDGKPRFVFFTVDRSTGVEREQTRYVIPAQDFKSQELFLLGVEIQKDTIPELGLIRTIEKKIYPPLKDYPQERCNEEINITKITQQGKTLNVFTAKAHGSELIGRYRDMADKNVNVDSLSFGGNIEWVNIEWGNIEYRAFYDRNGNIDEISIGSIGPANKKAAELHIAVAEDSPYFEVFDPIRDETISSENIILQVSGGSGVKKSQVFSWEDFPCQVQDSQAAISVRIGGMTINARKSVGNANKMYAIASIEGYTGWEKVLEDTPIHTSLSPVDKSLFI